MATSNKLLRTYLKTRITIAAILALLSASAHGQRPLVDGADRSVLKPQAVEFVSPEEITIPANQATTVALHFRIVPGLHINSHTPGADQLIPTTLTIPEAFGVRLLGAVYPPGEAFTLPLDPTTKLSVYSGDFTLQARIQAAAGPHSVEALLRYQACDNRACMPPKTITVAINVIGE
jgi:DsbC/DsbD-like thiol-disulfide interchange protein